MMCGFMQLYVSGSFMLFMSCFVLCFRARLFIDALWSPAGKELTSLRSFVMTNCDKSLSHWYLGAGVVLDCIDS